MIQKFRRRGITRRSKALRQAAREIDSLSTREERINRLAELNVVAQVKNLYQTSILRKCMREGNAPQIHGWVLNLHTGLIQDLQLKTSAWELHRPTGELPLLERQN